LQDTLWASGYEVYDSFSPVYQRFLDGLTATYTQSLFAQAAKDYKFRLYEEPRGSPLNVGGELSTEHPVIAPIRLLAGSPSSQLAIMSNTLIG